MGSQHLTSYRPNNSQQPQHGPDRRPPGARQTVQQRLRQVGQEMYQAGQKRVPEDCHRHCYRICFELRNRTKQSKSFYVIDIYCYAVYVARIIIWKKIFSKREKKKKKKKKKKS